MESSLLTISRDPGILDDDLFWFQPWIVFQDGWIDTLLGGLGAIFGIFPEILGMSNHPN